MQIKIISFLIFFSIVIYSQEHLLTINLDGKTTTITSLKRKGIDYVSGNNLAEILSLTKYYNPDNNKLELMSDNQIIKFTVMSRFVVTISRTDYSQNVVQIPIPILPAKNDLLIPLSYCTEIFSSTLNKEIKVQTYSSKTADTDKSSNKESVTDDKENEKKTLPLHDVKSISLDVKSNGTLIKIALRKKPGRYTHTISEGTLYLNVVGIKADPKITSMLEPKGLIQKISVKPVANSTQFEFHLNDGYSNSEVFKDGHNLLITIHNKLLSNYDKIKERWNFDAVVIDAGHGGKDPGAIGINGVKEKDVNLAIAKKVGELIEQEMNDIKVIYTRSTDKFVELYKRGKIANEKNGKLFISIHCNSTPKKPTNRNGFEVYLLRPGRTAEAISIAERENSVINYEENPERYNELTDENFILVTMAHSSYMRYSEKFSDILNKNFSDHCELKTNGVKQAGFYVLVGASMPSVLIETGFLSNKEDAKYLSSNKGQADIAKAIFDAIKEFKKDYNGG